MQQVRSAVVGACALVCIATAIGLASNALRSDGLALVRKPLSETRAVVSRNQLMANAPIGARPPAKGATEGSVSRADPRKATAVLLDANTPQHLEPKKPVPTAANAAGRAPKAAQDPQGGSPQARKPGPSPNKIQALFTNLNDAKTCFDNNEAIFLDARPAEDYEAEHITGALWLCYESVEEDYDKVLGQTPKDRLLITYCSDQQCASAIKLADELVARGHTRVVIMLEGLPGWKDAGYPTSSGKEAGK